MSEDARLYLHFTEICDADGAISTCCHQAPVPFLRIKQNDHLPVRDNED